MALRVLWPEGEPSLAVKTANPLKDWWLSFQWGMRGKRTSRVTGGISAATNAIGIARECDRLPEGPRPWHPDALKGNCFLEFKGDPAMDRISSMVNRGEL